MREAARAAARQSGLSVGEWLNSVIEVVDEQEGEFPPSTGLDRFSDDGSRQSVRSADRWHRHTDWDDREANAQRRQNFRAEDPQQDRRYRDADWDDREANAQRRQNFRAEDPQQHRRYRDADWDDREANLSGARTSALKSERTIVGTLTSTGAIPLPWKRRRIGTTAKAALMVKTAGDIGQTSRRLAKRQLVATLSRRRRIRG